MSPESIESRFAFLEGNIQGSLRALHTDFSRMERTFGPLSGQFVAAISDLEHVTEDMKGLADVVREHRAESDKAHRELDQKIDTKITELRKQLDEDRRDARRNRTTVLVALISGVFLLFATVVGILPLLINP